MIVVEEVYLDMQPNFYSDGSFESEFEVCDSVI